LDIEERENRNIVSAISPTIGLFFLAELLQFSSFFFLFSSGRSKRKKYALMQKFNQKEQT